MLKPQRKHANTVESDTPSAHWADQTADELISKHPQKDTFVCASGISPSGVVHIGNFREAITVDFVVRALKDRGKKVRFIYSWDDYDAFRKVPANLPNKELLEANLRKPVTKVPDPFGECPSYAAHFERLFEKEIGQLGILPEYIYQTVPYSEGRYTQGIRDALKHEKEIAAILNRARTEPLPENWSCVSIFCRQCDRDTTSVKSFEAPSTFHYHCKHCRADLSVNFEREGGVKLLWRVDWPMRWAREGVDFEPGGKDHSSQGGSYETGAQIIREIWKREPPHYLQYDFVLAKGVGAKLSSSSGTLITVGEALEIYEPAVIRWLFASRKPNLDFSIAFDLDVMKAYDDYDRCERFAYGAEPGEEKKVSYERRIYELSRIASSPTTGELPAQFPFRHLCNILQINLGDLAKSMAYFQSTIKGVEDEARFHSRAGRAWKWITTFAPEDFRFALRAPDSQPPKAKYPEAVKDLIQYLRLGNLESRREEEVASGIYEIMKAHSIEPKAFFQEIYSLLIAKTSGPKLASFLVAIGPMRAAELLERSL